MPAHLEVRTEGDHEWVVLIGGNGERAAARLRALWASEVSDIVDGRP